ncbi:MAG: hypothetical protein JRE23_09770 [Deltaproteobacteria bacterium]|jgi:hypothetical protein|nr:hypothetical protein [Deltaproteobacteria bacterium]
MKKDSEDDTLKDLALIEYFINYQVSLDHEVHENNKISRFAIPRHTQWIGWLIEPSDEDDPQTPF